MNNEDEIQKGYIELQLLSNQIKQITQQLALLDQHILELRVVEDSLNGIDKTKTGTEILIPLGSGIFTKGTLKEANEILINVGANVVVKKNIKDTKEIIAKEIEEIRKTMKQLEEGIQDMNIRGKSIEEEIRELSSKVKK